MKRSSNVKKTFYIYALTAPGDKEVRYVGLSSIPIADRLDEHVRKLSGKHSARAEWIRSLLAKGQRPEIHLLKELVGWRRAALTVEHAFVVEFHREGHRLLNVPLPSDEAAAQ